MSPVPRNVLLVEGPDDKGVCEAFLRRLSLDVTVRNGGGYESLRPLIQAEALVEVAVQPRLGIVVDADGSVENRWRSLCDILRPLGYNLPDAPDPAGTLCEAAFRPRLGLWLMPDNRTSGAIERFVSDLIPLDDPLWPLAGQAVDAVPEGIRPWHRPGGAADANQRKTEKVKVHTWLTWQEGTGSALRHAFDRGHVGFGVDPGQSFAAWLNRLFG
jgi:hypothetical protein